jgi:hypothetical protein
MKRTTLLVLIALTFALTSCASRSPYPSTQSPLNLSRVVLYRSGIGYFERQGELEEDILRIKVRRDQINDLLKSLTVIDRRSGQALSVSMPLDPQSWADAAMTKVSGGHNLASLLDGLRGTNIKLHAAEGSVRGRLMLVEPISNAPLPGPRGDLRPAGNSDHKISLLDGSRIRVVLLSTVKAMTLEDGDLAMQLHRQLDVRAGEGMFQQVEVAVRLTANSSHDLQVSYVVAAPLWKPTYRVVLPKDGKGEGLLQGWAVVDNTSGEDWTEVHLSLTSGEPIAFRYDLHTPQNVHRPDLTRAGVHKRAAVATGETAFEAFSDDEMAAPPMPETMVGSKFGAGAEPRSAIRRKRKSSATSGISDRELRGSMSVKTTTKKVSGLVAFELGDRVTVPNGSSTMVALLNETIEAEEAFLFRPGGAGRGYENNPYRVLRFRNTTPFVLEPGPIAVFGGGNFVGEGLSEAIGTQTSATIPFAVEPSIMVESKTGSHSGEQTLTKLVRGVLHVESFERRETTWKVRGVKKERSYTVLVRHNKAGSNFELVSEHPRKEDLGNAYFLRIEVPAGQTQAEITVEERRPRTTTIKIWDGNAPKLLENVMMTADLDASLRAEIEIIVGLRRDIGKIDTKTNGLKRQQRELDSRAKETRENLNAIKKDNAANALRRKLSKRLNDFTAEADQIGRTIVTLQSERLEKKIDLEDRLEVLTFQAPSQP